MLKKIIHLLRHGSLPRENDGAIEFLRIKDSLQKHVLYCHRWSDDKWKKTMARGGGKKRDQYCTDSSRIILYLRALQGHSGRSFIDPTLQDNVILSNFFQNIYHVGCTINLRSINSGLIPGGQNLSNRQTMYFLPVDPMDKNHVDTDTIDLNAPRHAQYIHKAWKKLKNNTEIFSFLLLLLPCCQSTCRQTNDDNTRHVSEDNLLFSSIQSLDHFFLGRPP